MITWKTNVLNNQYRIVIFNIIYVIFLSTLVILWQKLTQVVQEVLSIFKYRLTVKNGQDFLDTQ